MDYTQLIETYYINRDADHHLVKGEPITTNEGAIGVTTKVMDGDKEVDGASIVLWLKPGSVLGTFPMVFCHKEIDPTTEEETFTDAMQYNDDGTMTIIDTTYTAMTPYKELEAGKSFLDLTLNNMLEHIFVEAASLTKEEKEELAALTDMGASELLEEFTEIHSGDKVKIALDPAGGQAAIDGILSYNDDGTDCDNPCITTYIDPLLRTQIGTYDYKVTAYKTTGAPYTGCELTVKDKSLDGCTVVVPGEYATVGGFVNVRITFSWVKSGERAKRHVSCLCTLNNWNDPVIMVEDDDIYDICEAAGMICDPATVDPDNFDGCRMLTQAEMVNAPAMTKCRANNYLTSRDKKVQQFTNLGYTAAEAADYASKCMLLSEAKAVAENKINFKNANMTHFESFAYFLNFGQTEGVGGSMFTGNANLEVLYLPLTIQYLPELCGAYSNLPLLTVIQTLKD